MRDGPPSDAPSDVLTALLGRLRVTTSRFGRVELGAPWAARIGSRGTVSLHHLLEGELWLEVEGDGVQVGRGDLVVLPHGSAHSIRHHRDAPDEDTEPWSGSSEPESLSVRRRYGGAGATTVVLCAELVVAGASRERLLRALPAVVHTRAGGAVRGLGHLLDVLREEVRQPRAGTPVVAARLAELILVQGVAAELERQAAAGSWRGGLADERVARVLDAIYAAPERAWTVDGLARVARMGRTAFNDLFRNLVGETPYAHLTRWRMEVARSILRDEPGRTLEDVAAAVGYSDQFAFGTAFRRLVGTPPGAYRTSAADGLGSCRPPRRSPTRSEPASTPPP